MKQRTPDTLAKIIKYIIKRNWQLPSLRGANLYGADLRGANLYDANLRDADLYDADLYDADLYGANLYGANLRRTDLRGANLYGANLYGADLYGANLYGANLTNANLTGADLLGANLYGTKLTQPLGMTSGEFDIAASKNADGNFTYYAGCFQGNASEMVAKTLKARSLHQAKQVFYRCLSHCADTADEQAFLDAIEALKESE